ncbi:MAG TPA: hypothetical protein VKD71_09065 [Gemmataceae bacterium]|nr:hypothetical protein [Gemmataceae bacterium]
MIRILFIATLILWVGTQVGFAADTPKAEDQAKEAVEQFVKAVKAKDVDATLKIAGVPWFADGKRVIKDADEFKKYVKEKLDGLTDPERVPSQVLKVEPWEKFTGRGRLGAEEAKMADEVLGKSGLAVVIGRDGKEAGVILVRVDEGKAKVVGVGN